MIQNRLKELCDQHNMSIRELARKAHISSAHMNRLARGEGKMTLTQVMKICGVLNVNSNEVFGLPFNRKFRESCDDVLLGTITVGLLDSADQYGVRLNEKDLSKWACFSYKEAVAKHLNGPAVNDLTETVVKVLSLVRKKPDCD
jgi:transcriptional regulator with XRE-family HTH domain